MSSKGLGLFGIILAIMLVAGPLASNALAATDHGDAHAGHDMSTMNQSDQTNVHDVHNMEDMSHDEAIEHGKAAEGNHGITHDSHESGEKSHDSGENSHDLSGGTHDSSSGGHGGEAQDPNAPPNWPAIYGFGAFNLLVIIAAALLKNKV